MYHLSEHIVASTEASRAIEFCKAAGHELLNYIQSHKSVNLSSTTGSAAFCNTKEVVVEWMEIYQTLELAVMLVSTSRIVVFRM